jgi:hypothetical protein
MKEMAMTPIFSRQLSNSVCVDKILPFENATSNRRELDLPTFDANMRLTKHLHRRARWYKSASGLYNRLVEASRFPPMYSMSSSQPVESRRGTQSILFFLLWENA